MSWSAVVGVNFRSWFNVDNGAGSPKAGLLSGDFSVTVVALDDSASTTAAVTESTQVSGLYYFDVPGAFLTTHGAGQYGVNIVASTSSPVFAATSGSLISVSQKDIDLLGVTLDIVAVDAAIARKAITNRMEEFAGTPGTLILWDDDSITPLLTWSLRDSAGNGVVSTPNSPAKRGKAT